MAIYQVFTGKSFEEIEREFDGKGYGDFKEAVGAVVADGLAPSRANTAASWRTRTMWTAS